jgi:hypothetical protein
LVIVLVPMNAIIDGANIFVSLSVEPMIVLIGMARVISIGPIKLGRNLLL